MNVVVYSQSVLVSLTVSTGFISKVGFWVSVFASLGSSIAGPPYDHFRVFLTRSDDTVNKMGQGTLCDAYIGISMHVIQ